MQLLMRFLETLRAAHAEARDRRLFDRIRQERAARRLGG